MRYTTLLSRHLTHHAAALVALSSLALTLLALTSSFAPAFADPPEPDGPPPAGAVPLSPELQAALREFLNYDPLRMPAAKPASPLREPAQNARELDWNRTDKPDGTSAVTVKKPLPTPWDAKVGADLSLAAPPATTFQPDKPYSDNGSGAAWATVTVPGVASVDARIDPLKEQRKLGTTFSRSLPISGQYSVTLQNSYAVTETLGGAPATLAAPGTTATPTPAQVWSNDRLVKFNVLSTGTSLAAGTTSSTIDNIMRNKFSAEQKLFDSLNVTTAVTDVGSGRPANKSITAGFKLKW